ncbi:beta-galactosidase [Leifsonia sp. NPDC077715]|uniref:beta-galactosidase n=1 Tax=Leifsonia sp. NPDC077715 TaxID=3155539 RepID=UPI003425A6F8
MLIPDADGMILGCDYNPEQWDRAVWREDIALMRELGVGLVAINIFGWAEVNPAKGVWDFSGLDEIIGLLHDAGIRVNLGTATSSTPAWLTTLHPELLPVAIDGTRRFPGGRQAFCPSSPVYRRYALALVERIAERYGDHPAVALWHVSNEMGCHNALCYCDESAAAFRGWLRERYATIGRLNEAWGTAFWSQRYGAWDEVLPPRATLSTRNPAQVVDFHRFSSDTLLDHFRAEQEVIRRHSDRPVTTNLMNAAHIQNMDYWSWAGDLDLIANDHYLDDRLDDPTTELAFAADLTRGLAQGRPWMLMETSTGAVNWQPVNLAKAPGQLLRNALTHVARGADAICFFQWRASVRGSEKFHSALLPHAGTDSATWREAQELARALGALSEVTGTTVRAEVAIVFSWQSWWAANGDNLPSQNVRYLEQVHAAYRALRAAGVTVDVVAPGADLTGYRLVAVPALYSLTESQAAGLHRYVEQGGHAVVTFFSGLVDEEQAVVTGGYPGLLRDLLGVRMDEFTPLVPGDSVRLSSGRTGAVWSERGRATTATVVDTFAEGPAAGSPAITRNAYGDGTAWYVATELDQLDLDDLVREALDGAGVAPLAAGAAELDVTRRVGADGTSFLFAINHGDHEVELASTGVDLLSGERLESSVVVSAGGVRIIREDAAPVLVPAGDAGISREEAS